MKNEIQFKQLFLLLLVFTFSAVVTFGQNCGDINTDGSTNIVDALLVAQCYVGLTNCASSEIGDVNCDRQVNIVDALLIAQLYVGLINSLNCCNTPTPSLLPFRIGISDIYILKRQSLGAVDFAGDVGVDGVEIDMGPLRTAETFLENKLLDPVQAQEFLDLAVENGVVFSSIGMVGFLAQDISTKDTLLTKMIPDTIQTMNNMGVKVAYLPIRGTNLKLNPDRRPAVVAQLKGTGELAEAAGVIFGIETTLTGEEEVALIDEIGSPAIKSYFNFKNPLEEGRDLIEELKIFGRDRIVQIHCTDEDGELLEDNDDIDMEKVRDTLAEMGWSGWLVMERSRVSSMSHRESFTANADYLRLFFQ